MLKRLSILLVLLHGFAILSCENDEEPKEADCNENPVTISNVTVTDANCLLKDGAIMIQATGGDGSYRYALNGGSPGTSPNFQGLGAGVYEVTVTDGKTCLVTSEVTVKNVNGMNISVATTNAGGCSASDGRITITASDGVEPYQYRLDEGSNSANNEFTGLARGTYTVEVSDASGCKVTQSVRITSGISFAATIQPIIQNKCAISGCHNGSQAPDFRVFKNIHDNAGQVKTLTGDGTMPQEGSLTQAEINAIACWVDDGALEN